jgi:hypothetical protein
LPLHASPAKRKISIIKEFSSEKSGKFSASMNYVLQLVSLSLNIFSHVSPSFSLPIDSPKGFSEGGENNRRLDIHRRHKHR